MQLSPKDQSKISKQESNDQLPKTNIKLHRDSSSLLKSLEKGNIVFKLPSMEIFRVVSFINKETTQIKIKSDSTGQTTTISNENISDYTFFKSIKIILINHLERIFELDIPIYVNQTFDVVKDDFCTTYKCFHESIGIVFRDKRLTNKDLSKLSLYKDYDFDKDFLIFIQAKTENMLCRMEPSYKSLRISSNQVRKSIIIVENPIAVSYFFLSRGCYNNSNLRVHSFEIFELNENPKKYFKQIKKKKSDTETCESFNFDSLLLQDPEKISNAKIIFKKDNMILKYETETEDSFYGYLKSSYKQIEAEPELIFFPEKIYFSKINCIGTNNIRTQRYEKGKKTFSDDNGSTEISQFLEKNYKESLINGLEFRLVSTFDI